MPHGSSAGAKVQRWIISERSIVRRGKETRLAVAPESSGVTSRDPALIKLLVKAQIAREAVQGSNGTSISELAAAHGYTRDYSACYCASPISRPYRCSHSRWHADAAYLSRPPRRCGGHPWNRLHGMNLVLIALRGRRKTMRGKQLFQAHIGHADLRRQVSHRCRPCPRAQLVRRHENVIPAVQLTHWGPARLRVVPAL